MSTQQTGPCCRFGDAELAATDITILLPPPSGCAGFLALTTHTHTFATLGSHRLEGQMLFLSKGADLQKGSFSIKHTLESRRKSLLERGRGWGGAFIISQDDQAQLCQEDATGVPLKNI